jgi:hypothetical protein
MQMNKRLNIRIAVKLVILPALILPFCHFVYSQSKPVGKVDERLKFSGERTSIRMTLLMLSMDSNVRIGVELSRPEDAEALATINERQERELHEILDDIVLRSGKYQWTYHNEVIQIFPKRALVLF